MANEQNLRPGEYKLSQEEAKKVVEKLKAYNVGVDVNDWHPVTLKELLSKRH